MRIIFHTRSLKFFIRKNWYGIRTGYAWTIPPTKKIWLLDLGAITIGFAIEGV